MVWVCTSVSQVDARIGRACAGQALSWNSQSSHRPQGPRPARSAGRPARPGRGLEPKPASKGQIALRSAPTKALLTPAKPKPDKALLLSKLELPDGEVWAWSVYHDQAIPLPNAWGRCSSRAAPRPWSRRTSTSPPASTSWSPRPRSSSRSRTGRAHGGKRSHVHARRGRRLRRRVRGRVEHAPAERRPLVPEAGAHRAAVPGLGPGQARARGREGDVDPRRGAEELLRRRRPLLTG